MWASRHTPQRAPSPHLRLGREEEILVPTCIQVVPECDLTRMADTSPGCPPPCQYARLTSANALRRLTACTESILCCPPTHSRVVGTTQSRGNVQCRGCCLVLRNLSRKTENARVSDYCNLNRLRTGIKT